MLNIKRVTRGTYPCKFFYLFRCCWNIDISYQIFKIYVDTRSKRALWRSKQRHNTCIFKCESFLDTDAIEQYISIFFDTLRKHKVFFYNTTCYLKTDFVVFIWNISNDYLKVIAYAIISGLNGSLPIPRPARTSNPAASHCSSASSDWELRR